MDRELSLKLLSLLHSQGVQSPASLIQRLKISQPTLFRAALAQPQSIIALGASRNRKLAALRAVRSLGAEVPFFKISSDGDITQIGDLLSLHPSAFAFRVKTEPLKPQFYPGLPFFLDDIKPQGFLGRSFCQNHADLKLPSRPMDWGNDDILEAIARRGEDLIGNLLVGTESFARFQSLSDSQSQVIDSSHPGESYVRAARAALEGALPGSSAGGEQQKFAAALRRGKKIIKVLVKFSPAGENFQARRWKDLLISEWIALELLRQSGFSAAEARVIDAGGRVFLETVRFDRVGAKGRKGVLSLSAFENEWTGRTSHWGASAVALERAKKISNEDLQKILVLESFGRLIANSDRHPGNLSFFWEPGDQKVILAPVYDMLPMLYAPTPSEEDTTRKFQFPQIEPILLEAWKIALPLALKYWKTVETDTRLSRNFKKIAGENLKIIRKK